MKHTPKDVIKVDFLRKEVIEEDDEPMTPAEERIALLQALAREGILERAATFLGSLKKFRKGGAHRDTYVMYQDKSPVVLISILKQGEDLLWQKNPQFYLAIAQILREKIRASFMKHEDTFNEWSA